MARGTVKFWKAEKGWGAISSADLPAGRGDAFAHFSEVVGDGFRELEQGDVVEFDVEEGQQDSFQFRALNVRKV
ncbi:cold shock domain-containing protein [Nonomuraea sp. NPDC050680]|uniref:cold-shock protein n=1 Tax=Nonomuraea sp. NPDC050680 TaxID=3154630 RepID=UPI0033EA2F3F